MCQALTDGNIAAVLSTNRLIVISSAAGEEIEAMDSGEAPAHFVMPVARCSVDGNTTKRGDGSGSGPRAGGGGGGGGGEGNGRHSEDRDGSGVGGGVRAFHAAVATRGSVLTLLSQSQHSPVREARVMGRACQIMPATSSSTF